MTKTTIKTDELSSIPKLYSVIEILRIKPKVFHRINTYPLHANTKSFNEYFEEIVFSSSFINRYKKR